MELHVQNELYQNILDGRKTLEGRLGKEKYKHLKVGDTLLFYTDDREPIHKIIKRIEEFDSFRSAFQKLDYKSSIPYANSLEEALTVYGTFYSLEDQRKFKVLFFEF